jgi:hypothetical protein
MNNDVIRRLRMTMRRHDERFKERLLARLGSGLCGCPGVRAADNAHQSTIEHAGKCSPHGGPITHRSADSERYADSQSNIDADLDTDVHANRHPHGDPASERGCLSPSRTTQD